MGICISIDSEEWPKTYYFERKTKNDFKSFEINGFTFQNILHLFLLSETSILVVANRGLNPPPPFADMSTTNSYLLLTPFLSSDVL